MGENELKKLKRSDLLEILLQQNNEIDRLSSEVKRLKEELNRNDIRINKAGSIAEAALELNNVFSAADAACAQYIENIKRRSEQQEKICSDMLAETKKKCEQMIADAQKASDDYWLKTENQIKQVLKETQGLRELLSR